MESQTPQKIKILAAVGIIGIGLVAAWWVDADQLLIIGEWLEGNRSAAVVALLVCHVLASLLVLPGWVFIALAGYLFGVPLGLGLAYLSTITACMAVFAMGRTLVRRWVQERLKTFSTLKALDKAVTENGFVIVLLTRLSVVLPLSLLNYSYSVTGVSWSQYFLGTAIGMIPAVAMYTFLGASVGDITSLLAGDAQALEEGWIIWVSLAIAIGVTVWIARLTNTTLKRHLDEAGDLQQQD